VPLPHAAPLLLGLTTLQGQAVPLLDLAALLGYPAPTSQLILLADLAGEVLAWPIELAEGLAELPSAALGHEPFGEAAHAGAPRPLNLAALLQHARAALQNAVTSLSTPT